MSSKHVYFGMIGCLVLLLGAIIGGTYFANQQLQQQAKKLQDYKTQQEVLRREQTGLVKAKKDIARYSELEKIAKSIVPQDKDQAQTVREIIKIAGEAGIKPTSISFPASSLGNTAPAGAGAAVTPKPAAGASKQSLSQLTPVKGMNGVYNLQITVLTDTNAPVPFSRFLDFLTRLENNRRTAQVSSIVLQPLTQDRNNITFTLTVDEFIKP
jgi:hypothetical protein